MKRRLANRPNHWVHWVNEEREPDEEAMVSWRNGFDRRELTLRQLVGNEAAAHRYAYDFNYNRLTVADKAAIKKNLSRGLGHYKSSRDDDRSDKRQRRGYY